MSKFWRLQFDQRQVILQDNTAHDLRPEKFGYLHSKEPECLLFRLAASSLTDFFSKEPVVRLFGSSLDTSGIPATPESVESFNVSPESGVFAWNYKYFIIQLQVQMK